MSYFFAEVVNRGDGKEGGKKDSTQSGRVQIKVHGMNEGMQNQDTLWAMPVMPMGSGASLTGVGSAPVGLKNGSTVFGIYADKEKTVPIILGMLHKAGGDKGNDGTNLDNQKNDTPKGSRDSEGGGKDENDIHGYAITEDGGEKAAKKGQKHKDKKTIGIAKQNGNEEALDIINQEDSENESGSIQPAVKNSKAILDQLAQSGGFMGGFDGLSSLGAGGLGQIMQMGQQAIGMIGGAGGGGGGGGGSGGMGAAPIAPTPLETPKQSQRIVGGIPIDITYDNVTTTGIYKKDAIAPVIEDDGTVMTPGSEAINYVVIITNTKIDEYGGIVECIGSLSVNDEELAKDVPIADIISRSIAVGPLCEAVVEAVQAANVANNLSQNAFNNGSNSLPPANPNNGGSGGGGAGNMLGQIMGPLQSIISSMGGLDGMMGMQSDNSTELGPLTKNFTPATQTAKSIQQQVEEMFSGGGGMGDTGGLGDMMNGAGLGNIGNISGILDTIQSVVGQVAGSTGVAAGGSLIKPSTASVYNALNTPPSLTNSSVELPSVSQSTYAQASGNNPGVNVRVNTNLPAAPVSVIKNKPSIVGSVEPNYNYNESTSSINSLNNSGIDVKIPSNQNPLNIQNSLNNNPGVNYKVTEE